MLRKILSEKKIKEKINKKIKQISDLLTDSSILPKPVKRNDKAQLVVNKQCSNLRLYQTNTCPYCLKVRLKIRELGLMIQLINTNEKIHKEEMIAQGGKSQVPCLRVISSDGGKDKWIYESDVINRYLEENFKLLTNL